jgi:hypothetical protein
VKTRHQSLTVKTQKTTCHSELNHTQPSHPRRSKDRLGSIFQKPADGWHGLLLPKLCANPYLGIVTQLHKQRNITAQHANHRKAKSKCKHPASDESLLRFDVKEISLHESTSTAKSKGNLRFFCAQAIETDGGVRWLDSIAGFQFRCAIETNSRSKNKSHAPKLWQVGRD